ncbi:MAG: type II toxin-antitoxin system HicB family antitoxin [Fusobacterium sp.]|uniref:type II toxin-antitoxin system HicB family antitoxin n=1 Tax=Fusobacterium sp. TaxID=68766 RepID=UPI0029423291|nr:type II toxin-antitoxin system HicB family antitoxin [Fusobacterium sp.]MDY3058807.1 type II toxin-antitoxin system HicB family antitoxin [Fusobacterium sp.]
MNLTYPAIITYEDNVFYIGFPDFEKEFYNTYGDTFEEAVEMGKEYLVLLLEELENEKKEFPAPSKIKKVKELLEDNQELVYISLNYEYEKSLVKIAYVKKTLTIPSYLDILAKNKNINFSQVLQEALKEKLLIK